ncbi:MAG: membrane protein [Saprospiraceae bacterium]|nr:MAG: membrane protein [Saprospiraceae bacterium]
MDVILLFKIGFLPISLWDFLDVLIVGYLMSQIYRLLRGSIAFNIFIGVILLYIVWWLVNQLEMRLLSAVLNLFVNVGVIVIIIIFQPEVRRFLLFLGNSTIRQRSNFLDRILNRNFETGDRKKQMVHDLQTAMIRMARQRIGALIVFNKNVNLDGLVSSGVVLDATLSQPLIESIFNKNSPLHDGAIIIGSGKISMASCVLPVSDNSNLPKSIGLRHRAAVGITEKAGVAAFVVSEETGRISFAFEGELERKISHERLLELLQEHLV